MDRHNVEGCSSSHRCRGSSSSSDLNLPKTANQTELSAPTPESEDNALPCELDFEARPMMSSAPFPGTVKLYPHLLPEPSDRPIYSQASGGWSDAAPRIGSLWGNYQTLINRLILALRDSQELETILQTAAVGIGEVLECDRTLIILLKYSEPLLNQRTQRATSKIRATVAQHWVSGEIASSATEDPFWVSECSLCQQLINAEPQALAVSNLNAEKTTPTAKNRMSKITPLFQRTEFPALLLVPLTGSNHLISNQSTVLGFLALQQRQPRLWQTGEVEFAELIAAQISSAIIQTQTLRQVQALVEERTAQLQRSLEVQAKLYEQTRRHIEQLRHLNQLKDEFLSTMNHELRTPLTSMALAIRMLRQSDLSEERRQKYLQILEQQCSQEAALVDDLLALQKLETKQFPLDCQVIDVKLLVQELAQSFETKWPDKQLGFEIEFPKRSLKLQSDLESLRRILEELLTNAGKYSHPGTKIVIRAGHQVQEDCDQIVIALTNTGLGIPTAELPYIFDKFRRGIGITQQAIPGTGLGLALVKGLVQHLRGAIAATSQPLNSTQDTPTWETCFTLILPQSPSLEKA